MKIIKLSLLILVLLTLVPSFQSKAEAQFGFSVGVGYYPGYHGYGYYPRYGYGYYPRYYGYPYAAPYYWGGPFFGGGYYAPYAAYYGYPGYYYPYFGEVRTEVKPKEAQVFIDGAYVGNVDSFDGWWQRLQLVPGKHRIVFRAPGYAPFAMTINAIPGQDIVIKQQLQPGQDVISEEDMQLSESERQDERSGPPPQGENNPYDPNNQYERNNPYGNQNRNAPPNPYRENQQPPPQQDNNRVTLVLKVEPKDATIYINENYYGTAEANSSGEVQVLLPQGVHKIEVVRPGYESYSKEIQVDVQSQNRLDITLQKK